MRRAGAAALLGLATLGAGPAASAENYRRWLTDPMPGDLSESDQNRTVQAGT